MTEQTGDVLRPFVMIGWRGGVLQQQPTSKPDRDAALAAARLAFPNSPVVVVALDED